MLTREAQDRFRVDFARAPREAGWRKLLRVGTREPVVVDGFAIGQAVLQALAACPFRNAAGAPQVWNEYKLFLARADHDRLRPVEHALQQELGPMVYEALLRTGASTIGSVTVRLLVDDEDEIDAGTAILHARHVPDAHAEAAVTGELTVRLDKVAAPPPAPSPTLRVGGVVLATPGGEVTLADGVRHVLGRAHPGAGDDHLPLPGAGTKVNRRQCWVRVDGAAVEVGREAGDSNPVGVNGSALAPGQSVVAPLPVEISLSGGAYVVQARAC